MGLWASRFYNFVSEAFASKPARIIMLGLDAAGKTTILYKVKLNESVVTIPTVGFNVEEVEIGKGLRFTVWDVGGQTAIRRLWHHYFRGSEGVVFVVDSADPSRFAEAREELQAIVAADELAGVPVEVLANKADLPHAASASQVAEAMGLHQLRGREWHTQATCAATGEGLYEGLQHCADLVRKRRSRLS